jgi:hypothetical protein
LPVVGPDFASRSSPTPRSSPEFARAKNPYLQVAPVSFECSRSRRKNILISFFQKSCLCSPHPASSRGTLRPIVTKREAGLRWTRRLAYDDRRRRGRQRRVVLISRCWDQALSRRFERATVANKPGHRGERAISRKPSRRECRNVRRTCRDLRACSLPFARKAAGAFRHPAFPAPS